MGPISGTGRAMMASLNSAVQKGMPVDQAIAYVKSMAKDGVAPLVDLYAMLNQYQRLQQQQVKPPQTPPTIRDQMNMMEQQQAQQAQMQQGLGGLDTGVMENAQFAGGGIVNFQKGGLTAAEREELANLRRLEQAGAPTLSSSFNPAAGSIPGVMPLIPQSGIAAQLLEKNRKRLEELESKEEEEIRAAKEAAREQELAAEAEKYGLTYEPSTTVEEVAPTEEAAPEVTAPPVITPREERPTPIADFTASERAAIQKQIKELEGATPKSRADRYREAGIEDVIPGQIERLREQMSGLDEERKRDRYLALAEAGFGMAEAAAKPGGTLLGSLGVGGKAGARRLSEVNKEYRTLRSNLMGKVDEMERYRQGRLEGQIDRDIEFERESTKEIRRLQKDLAGLETDLAKFREQTKITREGREPKEEIERLKRAYVAAKQEGREEDAKRILGMLEDLARVSTGFITAQEQGKGKNSVLDQLVLNKGGADSSAYADTDKLTGYSP